MSSIKTIILFIAIFCGLQNVSMASETVYTIIYTRGDVALIKGGRMLHSSAIFLGGYTLSESDTLLMAKNSETELRGLQGEVVINKEGRWSLDMLGLIEKKEKTGILSGLFDMITGQEDTYADGFMREICGVSRGRQCPARFYPLFNYHAGSVHRHHKRCGACCRGCCAFYLGCDAW